MIGKLFGLWCGLLVLAGCASRGPLPEPDRWAPSAPCVMRLDHVLALDIPVPFRGRAARLDFRQLASCYMTDEGPMPVVLFSLADVTPPGQIDITLFPKRFYALAAAVEVLNREFDTIQSHPFDSFAKRSELFTRRIFINPDDEAAAYLMVRLDSEAYGGNLERIRGQADTTVIVLPTGVGSYTGGSESRTEVRFRDVGQFGIEVLANRDTAR